MVLAEDLRKAVLQAALQGKLTEQLETDSDVEEILIDIKWKKDNLITNKRFKKDRKWSDLNEEDELFAIPENWKWVHLGEVIIFLGGYAFKSTSYVKESKNQVIRLGNVKNNKLILGEKQVFIPDNIAKEAEDFEIKTNDILVTMTGTRHKQDYLYTVKVNENDLVNNHLYLNQRVGCFRILSNINADFLCFAMQNQEIRKIIFAKETGTANQGNLGSEDIKEYIYIPLPPIEEQQRIVDKINEIMPKIDEYEKIEKELEALKKEFPTNMKDALLQAVMQGKLTEQLESDSSVDELLICIEEDRKNRINGGLVKKDKRLFINYIDNEDIPIPIPNNWRGVTIGSIVYKLTDGTHITPKYAIEGVKFVSVKDMSSGKLDLSNTKFITQEEHDELYKRCNPEKGDMLLSKVGTTGVPAIIDTDEQFSLFVSVALLKFNHQFINEKFLYYLLMSPLVQEQVRENTRGIGNKNWVLDFIAKTVIVLPPIEEQQRIVETLDALLPLCEDLNGK